VKRALLCLVGLAAIVIPVTSAHAEAEQASCRVVAGQPRVTPSGLIRVVGVRANCGDAARTRIRLKKALAGPDRVVKSGSRVIVNGRLTLTTRCAAGTFYTTITDYRGHTAMSRKVRIRCGPALQPSSGGSVGSTVENEVVRLTNAERAKAGCGALKHNARLHTAATGHSADMSAQNYFDHTSKDGRSFADRIKAAGYRFTAAGENIAKGYRTAQAVVTGWMNSPGHRANILNCAYTDIGVGYVAAGGPYWTQDFGRS
jgi:uncharacterized protein YkwD